MGGILASNDFFNVDTQIDWIIIFVLPSFLQY
jgi:hypothetical protein